MKSKERIIKSQALKTFEKVGRRKLRGKQEQPTDMFKRLFKNVEYEDDFKKPKKKNDCVLIKIFQSAKIMDNMK